MSRNTIGIIVFFAYLSPIAIIAIVEAWKRGGAGLGLGEINGTRTDYFYVVMGSVLWPVFVGGFILAFPVHLAHWLGGRYQKSKVRRKAKLGSFGEKYFDRKDT